MKRLDWKPYRQLFLYGLIAIMVYLIYSRIDPQRTELAWRTFGARVSSPYEIFYIILVLLGLYLNLLVEALKWKRSLRSLYSVSLSESFRMVLRGMSSSFLTPNRSGDFIGKLYSIPADKRPPALALSIIGSLSQLLVTLVMGIWGLVWFYQTVDADASRFFSPWFFIIVSMLTAVVYLTRRRWFPLIASTRVGRSLATSYQTISSQNSSFWLELLALSFVKYFIFISQFYLLFVILGIDLSWYEILMTQSAIYLVMAIIPHNMLVDAAIRGPVSLYFYTRLGVDPISTLVATYSLFMINIVAPAVIGLVFFTKRANK